MANITSLGIGSGLQLESIVEAYINAEAVPQEIRLQEKEEKLSLELSGVGSFKSALSTFQSTLDKMTKADAFNQQKITSSDDAIEVTSNGFASNAIFDVEVQQLARGSEVKTSFSDPVSPVNGDTITLDIGSDSFNIDIAAGDDLSAIRDKINLQTQDTGVTVNLLNSDSGSYLIFNSETTGFDNNLTVSSTISGFTAHAQSAEQTSQNGIISINNEIITQDNNTFKNVIEDVTITAKKENIGNPSTITIAQDQEAGRELIDEFVEQFNQLSDELTGLGASKLGRLAFDPNVRQVKQQLTNIAINTVSGLSGSLSSLNDIGLELNRDGKLEVSTFSSENIQSGSERLDSALTENQQSVGELFASPNGIASQMSAIIESYNSFDGVLTQRENNLNEQIKGISDEWTALEERLRDFESTLRNQFTALDSVIAGYNATGEWLTSTLANLQPKKD